MPNVNRTEKRRAKRDMCVYACMYACTVCVCVCVYAYIYIVCVCVCVCVDEELVQRRPTSTDGRVGQVEDGRRESTTGAADGDHSILVHCGFASQEHISVLLTAQQQTVPICIQQAHLHAE
jgi:hypothetical protein